MKEIEDALLWLARSGGTLWFASAGMACGAPAHANAGYTVEAAVEGDRPAAARTSRAATRSAPPGCRRPSPASSPG